MKKSLVLVISLIISEGLVSQSFSLDNLGRLIEVIYSDSTAMEYCYDELGNRTCYNITSNNILEPDLYIHNPNLSSVDLCQNASFTIAYTEDNLGTGTSSGYFTKYYLSTDNNLDEGSDLLLGQLYSTGLAAGGIQTAVKTLDVPTGTNPGSYFLFVKVDATDLVTEISEINNVISTGLDINNGSGFSFDLTIVPSTCYQNNGSVSIINLTGQSPYNYTWSHEGNLNQSIASNLLSGTYYITINDANGCEEVSSAEVINNGGLPSVSFNYTLDGTAVIFNNQTSNGDNYSWNFGDVITSTDENPTHDYGVLGEYTVCLNADNSCGVDSLCLIVNTNTGGQSYNCSVTTENPFDGNYYNVYYGNDSVVLPTTIFHLDDNSLLMPMYPTTAQGSNFSILKLDERGDLVSNKHFLSNGKNLIYDIKQDSSGRIFFVGLTTSSSVDIYDGWVGELSYCGDIIWSKTIGGADEDRLYAFDFTESGDLICAGRTKSYGNGGYDVWVLNIDKTGNILWSNTYGRSWNDAGYGITVANLTNSFEYVITGYVSNVIGGPNRKSGLFLALDSAGDIVHKKGHYDTSGGAYHLQYTKVIEATINSSSLPYYTAVGNVLDDEMFGGISNVYYNGLLTRMGTTGNVSKARLIEDAYHGMEVHQLPSNEYIFSGNNHVLRLDENTLPVTLKSHGLYGSARISDFDVHESNIYFTGFNSFEGNNRPLSFTLDTILNETCYNQDYTLNTFEVNNWMNAFVLPSAFAKTVINPSQFIISSPTYTPLVDEYEQVEYCPIDECLTSVEIIQDDKDVCEGASLQFECMHQHTQNIKWYLDGVEQSEVYYNQVYFDINSVGTHELIVEASNSFCTVFDTIFIEVHPELVPFEMDFDVTPTQGLYSANGEIDASLISNPSQVSYQWSTDETTQDIANLKKGNYNLSVTYNEACTEIFHNISVDHEIDQDTSFTSKYTLETKEVFDLVALPNGDFIQAIDWVHGLNVARYNYLNQQEWRLNFKASNYTSSKMILNSLGDILIIASKTDWEVELIHIDDNGNLLMHKEILFERNNDPHVSIKAVSIVEVNPNKYVIGLNAYLNGDRIINYSTVDTLGNVAFSKSLLAGDDCYLTDMEYDVGTNYAYLTGSYQMGGDEYLYALMKIHVNTGQMVWKREYGGNHSSDGSEAKGLAISPTHIYTVGSLEISNVDRDIIMCHNKSNGDDVWIKEKTIGLYYMDCQYINNELKVMMFEHAAAKTHSASIDVSNGDLIRANRYIQLPYTQYNNARYKEAYDGGYFGFLNFPNQSGVVMKFDSLDQIGCGNLDYTSTFQNDFVTTTLTSDYESGVSVHNNDVTVTNLNITPTQQAYHNATYCPTCDVTGFASYQNNLSIQCPGDILSFVSDDINAEDSYWWLLNGCLVGDSTHLDLEVSEIDTHSLQLVQRKEMCFDTFTTQIIIGDPALLPHLPDSISVCGQYELSVDPIYNSYNWSNGDQTPSTLFNSSGWAFVTLTDSNSCEYIDSAYIDILPSLSVTYNIQADECGNNGSISLNTSDGNEPYFYSWSNGSSGNAAENLDGGSYTVTVSDNGSCSEIVSISVPDNDFEFDVITEESACYLYTSSIATINTQGAGPFNYSWSTGSTESAVSNLAVGTYSVSISDPTGCEIVESVNIQGAMPDLPDTTICPGQNLELNIPNTSKSMFANPQTIQDAHYYYRNHTPGMNIQNDLTLEFWIKPTSFAGDAIVISKAENFKVMHEGSTGQLVFEIENPNGIVVTYASDSPIPMGEWTHVAIVKDLSPKRIKFYFNGKLDVAHIPTLWLKSKAPTSPFEIGDVFGTAVVSFDEVRIWNKVLTPLEITEWMNKTLDNSHTSFSALRYYFTFEDDQSLITDHSTYGFDLIPNDAPQIVEESPWHSGSDFTWSNGQKGYSITVAPENTTTYSVTYSDGNSNCSDDILVTTDLGFTPTVNVVDPSCYGLTDGSVTLSVDPASTNYTNAWSDPVINSAGNYSVTVTEVSGCEEVIDFNLTEPNPLIVQFAKTDETVCGAKDGSATVVAVGGTTPYNYKWNYSAGSADTHSGLEQGSYAVTVTDANSCSEIKSVFIDGFQGLEMQADVITTPSVCGTTGSAEIIPADLTKTYTYEWSRNGEEDLLEFDFSNAQNKLVPNLHNSDFGVAYGNATTDNVLSVGLNTSDYLKLQNSSFNGLGDFSFESDFKLNQINSSINSIVSIANTAHANEFLLAYHPNDRFILHFQDFQYVFGSSLGIQTNSWYNIRAERIGDIFKVYLDGVLLGEQTSNSNLIDADFVVLGQEQDNVGGGFELSQCLDGELDNVKIKKLFHTEDAVANNLPAGPIYVTATDDQGCVTTFNAFVESIDMDIGEDEILTCQDEMVNISIDYPLEISSSFDQLELTHQIDTVLDYTKPFDFKWTTTQGETYLVLASGVYTVWHGCEYLELRRKYKDPAHHINFSAVTNRSLFSGAFAGIRPLLDVYNTEHEYYYKVDGNGNDIQIKFSDSGYNSSCQCYTNNCGHFRVSIFKIEDSNVNWSTGDAGLTTNVMVSSDTVVTASLTTPNYYCEDSVSITPLQIFRDELKATCANDSIEIEINDITNKSLNVHADLRYIRIPNDQSLQITEDLTIEMWLKPENYSQRRNPINKAFGGEFTLTHEKSGIMRLYHGTSGNNSQPYSSFATATSLPLNAWTHIALVRDYDNGTLRWYVNGVLDKSGTYGFGSAGASLNDVLIGDGYVKGYRGNIDEVRIWNEALDQQSIQEWKDQTVTNAHPYYANLALYHTMDVQKDNIFQDSSPNQNHGYKINNLMIADGYPHLINNTFVWQDGVTGNKRYITSSGVGDYSVVFNNGNINCEDSISIIQASLVNKWIEIDGDWHDASNWDVGYIPLKCQDVIIQNLFPGPNLNVKVDEDSRMLYKTLLIKERCNLLGY